MCANSGCTSEYCDYAGKWNEIFESTHLNSNGETPLS